MRLWRWSIFLLFVTGVAFGGRLDDAALRDSMMVKGSLMGQRWLEKNGLENYLSRQSWKPAIDSGLVCVGRWSYGPSLKVSLRATPSDTVICLTRGSGASLIRFRSQDSVTLDLLGDVNFAGIPRRAILSDTLVIAGIHSGGTGLEVHGVSNPAQPNLLSRIDLPVVDDIAVNDSLVYVACEDDTLRIYSIANPRSPALVGSCCDSCDLFMTQADNYCYLVHVSGVNIVDVSNPANPHRAGHIGGGEPLAVCVRDTLCYVTIYQNGLRVYDISDIGSPQLVGSLTGPDAMDLTMASNCDTVLYTPVLDIVSVADPAQPRLVGHAAVPEDMQEGVCAVPAGNYALVADYFDGVVVVNTVNPAVPSVDTMAFAGGSAEDIVIDGRKAYVASISTGLSILDVTDPSRPTRLGSLDYVGRLPSCPSVAARDSFAYVPWDSVPELRVVDVSDSAKPIQAGGCDVFTRAEDMLLHDSLLYLAMMNRFQIVNVARPREPVLVGSCNISGTGVDLLLRDTLAYVSSLPTQIINVVDPTSPVVIGTLPTYGNGLAVRDSIAFVPALYDSMVIYNVRNPSAPVRIGRYTFSDGHVWNAGVALVGTLLYVGGDLLHVLDISDPLNPTEVTVWHPPYDARRLVYDARYLYAACYEAGISILETIPTGIEERTEKGGVTGEFSVYPSITSGSVVITADSKVGRPIHLRLYDAAGVSISEKQMCVRRDRTGLDWSLDLSSLPDGVYFASLYGTERSFTTKVVKTRRR